MTYDLRNEPWIIGIERSGKQTKMGVREVFLRAQELKGIATPPFYKTVFTPFGHVVHRFLTTMAGDMYRMTETKKLELLEQGRFDQETMNRYFNDPSCHLDLFDPDHPFLQATDGDLKRCVKERILKPERLKKPSLGDALALNPTGPAQSGRICGLRMNEEQFLSFLGEKAVEDFRNGAVKDAKTAIPNALAACFPVTCETLPYLLLYNHSATAGIGQGHIKALSNADYWEMLQGRNLFETLVLNAPLYEKDRSGCDRPMWRWDSMFEGYDASGINVMSGMFAPVRVIRAYPNEEGGVSHILFDNVKVKYKENGKATGKTDPQPYNEKTQIRLPIWMKKEPYVPIHIKVTQKKGSGEIEETVFYDKLSDSDVVWLKLLDQIQTNSETATKNLLEDHFLFQMGMDEIPELQVMVWWRTHDQKWVHHQTGTIVVHLPSALLKDPAKRECLIRIREYIKMAGEKVREHFKAAVPKSATDRYRTKMGEVCNHMHLKQQLAVFCDALLGVTTGNGALKELAEIDPKEPQYEARLEKKTEEILRLIAGEAVRIYDRAQNANHEEYWVQKGKLSSTLYGRIKKRQPEEETKKTKTKKGRKKSA